MQNKNSIKIPAFQCVTKIQQAKPAYLSTLINKQLGYDVIVQTQDNQTQKITNCICSVRPNSQIYKRLSKRLINNLKHGVDQFVVFSGLHCQARMETSIGLRNNPGFFMIAGVALLDQKYRINHLNFDLEVAFLQYNEGKLIDLLNYTGQPLSYSKNENQIRNLGQSYTKVSTFKGFTKLFKIALFNNKERDIKTVKTEENLRVVSTFIMKLRVSLYQNQQLIKRQQNIFVDIPCQDSKQKGNKSYWDYLLIQLNNSNPANKKLHFHLVEPNYLLMLFKSFISTGQIFFVNSLAADKKQFKDNMNFLNNIRQHAGVNWEKTISVQVPLRNQINWQNINQQINTGMKMITQTHYSSLKQIDKFKYQCESLIRKSSQWIKQYKKILLKCLETRRKQRFLENTNVADQISLIGFCVKSDHFKDFYMAKTYLSLQREINIKTSGVRQQIRQIAKIFQQQKKILKSLKNKQEQLFTKFKKKYMNSSIQQFLHVIEQFMEYIFNFETILETINFRTITQQVVKVQQFVEELTKMEEFWKNFIFKFKSTSMTVLENCDQEKVQLLGNHHSLLKHIKNYKNIIEKQNKKVKKLFTKLPPVSDAKSNKCIKIEGLKLSNLLLNPNQP